MTTISVLGLGAMGSRMAANLLKAGYNVIVWNRTQQATQALQNAGASVADTPAAAAQVADIVLAMVRDDAASQQVWTDPVTGALPHMRPGAIAIDSSTLSVNWVKELGQCTHQAGVAFLEAPVSGSRPQAEAGQLVFLVGGDSAVLKQATPVLQTMGASIHHIGAIGSGALAKLTTNTLLGIQVTAYAELIGMLHRQGANPAAVLQAISHTSVWAPVAGYLAGTMLSGDFRPQFPVELIEKDFGYLIEAAGHTDNVPLANTARQAFQQGMDAGLGQSNMTAIVKLFHSH